MTQTTFYADASDGVVYSDSVVFATARAGGTLGFNDTPTDMYEGSNTGYRCHQMAIQFDTSSLAGRTVTAVELSLYDQTHLHNHIAQVRPYDWGAALGTADFVPGATFASLPILATFNLAGAHTNGDYNAFTETVLFKAYINTVGQTRVIINSDQFAAGNAPSGGEYWGVSTRETAGTAQAPKLIVTHEAASGGVVHDATSESTVAVPAQTTAPYSWVHTPVGTPRSVVVYAYSFEDENAPTVTYGGVAMTQVDSVTCTDGFDDVRVSAFHLGTLIPAGAQTVVVTPPAFLQYAYGVCLTATADSDTAYSGAATQGSSGTLSEQNITDSSPGTRSVRYAGVGSSLSAVPSVGPYTTAAQSIDLGTVGAAGGHVVFAAAYETTAGQGSRPVGFSAGSATTRAAVYFAVSENGYNPPSDPTPTNAGARWPTLRGRGGRRW